MIIVLKIIVLFIILNACTLLYSTAQYLWYSIDQRSDGWNPYHIFSLGNKDCYEVIKLVDLFRKLLITNTSFNRTWISLKFN